MADTFWLNMANITLAAVVAGCGLVTGIALVREAVGFLKRGKSTGL